MIISPKKIIKLLVFSFLLCILFSCQEDENINIEPETIDRIVFDPVSEKPLVTYLVNTKNAQSVTCNKQIRKSLDYAKIPYGKITLEEFNKNALIAPTCKVLVIYDLKPLSDCAMDNVVKFVAAGGTLFLPNTTENKRFGFLCGIKQTAEYDVTDKPQGYSFKIPYLPNFKNRSYQNRVPHFGLVRENFNNKIEVWANSFTDENFPTIIKNSIGKGKVIAFNTTQYAEKEDRGLFFSAILAGLEGVPYPVANVSTIFLDDFPSPVYDIKKENIKSEMDITQSEFYREVWWPDMAKLAEEENLIYSAYLCFDYRNLTDPPFLFKEWEASSFLIDEKQQSQPGYISRQIRKSKHELAFHGYNHVSLVEEEWPNKDFMVASLHSAQKKWKAGRYGKLPVTYVPPSNLIDSLGFAALERGMPSIKYTCSIYMGDFEDGGSREFDLEPYNNNFFNFPRITSGYVLDEAEEFNQQSLYLYTGIWTHFVHPDDVYQVAEDKNKAVAGNYEYRNKLDLGWRISKDGSPGLFPRFKEHIQQTKKEFPLMNFYSVKEGAKRTEQWRKTKYKHAAEKDFYKVSAEKKLKTEKQTWFTYISSKNESEFEEYLQQEKWNFSKIEFLKGFLYTIITEEASIKLPKFSSEKSGPEIKKTLQAYNNYLSDSVSFDDKREEITYFIAEGKVNKAITILKEKINTEKDLNPEEILELNKYLGWEERTDEIWPILEKKYLQNPSKKIVETSKTIAKQNGYSTEYLQQKWFKRQLEFDPNNVALKQEYNQLFAGSNETKLTTSEKISLFKNSEDLTLKANYFADILYSDKEKAIQLIDTIEPCTTFLIPALRTDIAWLYAEKENYKKALAWTSCETSISQETIEEWRIKTGEFQFLKEQNYPRYIEYLLAENPTQVTEELINENPCENAELHHQAYGIAYAYGDKGSYRKAIAWANCAKNFPVKDKMLWYYELQDLENVEKVYNESLTTAENPDELTATLADIYLYSNKLYNSAKLTASLPSGKTKTDLKEKINKEVIYAESDVQQKIIEEFPELIDEEISEKLQKKLRVDENDFIESHSNMVADRLRATSLGNKIAYGIRDKNLNTHTFGLTQYKAFSLQLNENFPNNTDQNLYGIEYSFKRKERNEKLNYSAATRIEFNEASKAFYHAQANISFAKDSLFSSAQLLFRPAITGPAYSLSIYQTQLTIYEELQLNKHWRGILSLESNYYSDDVLDGLLLTNLGYKIKIREKSSLLPYTEISGMLGNTNRENGYPYWTINERLYGGLGIEYAYIDPKSELKFSLGAATFLDTFSDSFQRYRGEINYPVLPYFYLTGNAEFYTLKNFYSNNFQLGLRYYLNSK